MRDYEHYALDPIGQFRRHPANAVWGEDGADRYLRSFPGDYAEWVEKQIEVDPYLSTPLREDLEDALDRFVERYRSGKVPPKDAWAGWWLQPREFARGMIRLEWELHYQRDLPGNRKATSEGRKATPIAKRDPAIQSDEERELQDDIQVYLSAVEGLEWWDTSRIGLSGYPDLQATLHGDSLFFEVKASTGRVQPQQERWHEHMRQTGATVEVVRSVDDVKHVIARLNAGQM